MPAQLPEDLAKRVREYVDALTDAEQTYCDECTAEAVSLVAGWAGTWWASVPATAQDRAVVEVAAELFNRKGTRNGIAAFDGGDDMQSFRIARDPLKAARPLLAPWIPAGIA
ncbi:MAG: hypothetical protein ACTH93_09135 [Pseudoclavibacter sp.]